MPSKKSKPKALKASNQDAHFQLVLEAAQRVVQVLTSHNLPCAVFGSLASRLYGASRCPKDVDLLVSQPASSSSEDSQQLLTPQQLKTLILDTDPQHFFLTLPRDPTAPYRILHYRKWYMGPECKVDILVPGIMHLPSIPPSYTTLVEGVPLVPFELLLLHKLQGWDDHRRMVDEPHKMRKQYQDAADVRRLMGMQEVMRGLFVKGKGRTRGASASTSTAATSTAATKSTTAATTTPAAQDDEDPPPLWWRNPALFSPEFQELTERRVQDYCLAFPERARRWRALGFDVPEPDALAKVREKAKAKGKGKGKGKAGDKGQGKGNGEGEGGERNGGGGGEDDDDDDDDDDAGGDEKPHLDLDADDDDDQPQDDTFQPRALRAPNRHPSRHRRLRSDPIIHNSNNFDDEPEPTATSTTGITSSGSRTTGDSDGVGELDLEPVKFAGLSASPLAHVRVDNVFGDE
ncbi:hypothetical protein CC1G_10111 [Coprinopsis cinerea okayama7|uniref:Uncharacterized protein n=1 Tax=Coprinopsis cinerea (strain Okayama-7 / 130 / ATCC MYA-4618 / FGSC 9003) TaxID=240176 RepID=A8N408_COPC7|nr:hypothetical protein CC1G_10111 [Coprinopsis cinerea okayama7\|eukprot:XP_001829581.1 hypothetical protein CC1G_10111 [Coprinopsis cinerea okayama7\